MVNNNMTALLKCFLATIGVNCVTYGTHYVRNILGVPQVTLIATNRKCELLYVSCSPHSESVLFYFCAELAEVNYNKNANS
jgi:hypothetical protein